MMSTCASSVVSAVAWLAGQSLAVALTLPQATSDAPPPPTPREQALVEHACMAAASAVDRDAYDRCLVTRLQQLRADFGRDLVNLTASERGRLDAACTPLQP
jgi:hypothetical protein